MTDQHTRITPEVVGNADPRRVLWLIVGMLCFLFIANAVSIALLDRYPINRSNWLVREKWNLLERSAPVSTLILGDSSCTQAVRPDVLDQGMGGSSLNLCTVGNMLAINDVWMLDEYLRRHGAPRRVLIVHVYHAWNREIDQGFAQLLGKIERPWMFWSELNPAVTLESQQLVDAAVSRWLPLYGEHKSLQRLVSSAYEGAPPAFALGSSGFMPVVTPNPERVRSDFANHVRQLSTVTPDKVLSEDNRRALVRLRELAEQYQLDIALAPAPIYDELWQTPAVQERVRLLQAAIRATIAGSRHIRIVTAPPPTFSANEMENVDHVVGDAAIRYTQWLVSALTSTNALRD